MDRAGELLKRARERLKLTYRDVEKASQIIATRRGSDEFAIALSRLADIENKATVPNIYRLYTLCAIYRLDFNEVLRWYGVPRDLLPSEAVRVGLPQTHAIQFGPRAASPVPQNSNAEIDLNKTTFLSHLMRRWGKMAFQFLDGQELSHHRYGFIGLEDWSMYPVLHPGSLVVIDETKRKIATAGWTDEHDRPIYFLEHRQGYVCGWCMLVGNRLLIQPHPASHQQPQSFGWPAEIDVLGQVTGVAMVLESSQRRPARASAARAKSPDP